MRILLTSLLLFVACLHMQGQTGVRFTFLDFERSHGKFQPNVLIGFDRDIADRLSIGVDVVKSFRFDPAPIPLTTNYNSSSFYYTVLREAWGMQYRSQFFMTHAFYVGTTIGFRQVNVTVEPDLYQSSMYPNQTPFYKQTGTTTIFPLGMRFGFRSELDSWYGDLYLGLGYNIGAARNMIRNADYLNKTNVLNTVWFNAGYAMGIGW